MMMGVDYTAKIVDLAAAEQELIRAEWKAHAQEADYGHSERVWREASRRVVDDGFVLPKGPARTSKVLVRHTMARVKRECRELITLSKNIKDLATFSATLRDRDFLYSLETKAIFQWAATGTWDSARSAFKSAKTITKGQRSSIIRMAKQLLEGPLMQYELFTMMESLDRPGSMGEKLCSIKAAEWKPEAENVLQKSGAWHSRTHRILRGKITPESIANITKELVQRSKPK
jgi:hypothetical protein